MFLVHESWVTWLNLQQIGTAGIHCIDISLIGHLLSQAVTFGNKSFARQARKMMGPFARKKNLLVWNSTTLLPFSQVCTLFLTMSNRAKNTCWILELHFEFLHVLTIKVTHSKECWFYIWRKLPMSKVFLKYNYFQIQSKALRKASYPKL